MKSAIQGLFDLEVAYSRFFRGQKKSVKFSKSTIARSKRTGKKLTFYDMVGHPKFKKRGLVKSSFYTTVDQFYFKDGKAVIAGIGHVVYKTNYQTVEGRLAVKYINPRVTYVNGKWILSVGVECENQAKQLNDFVVGIDVGIKELAVVSYDGGKELRFHNVNKEPRIRKLKNRLKHAQRELCRRRRPKGQEPSARYLKTRRRVIDLYFRLSCIRLDHVHKTTRAIVNLLPRKIVIEDLNIRGMMANRHLAKAIAEQCLNEFFRQIGYKSSDQQTEVQKADRFFPSSKRCSVCGSIKKDLKLKDRVYRCEKCGSIKDRDFNASCNLENYH